MCHSFPFQEQVSLNFKTVVTVCSDFEAQGKKICHCWHFFTFYLPWSGGTGCHNLSFLNVEFKASFFTLLFHPHQEVLRFSLLSAIRVVSSAYLRLLIFLAAILISVYDSSSLAFCTRYSAYKLNKQGDNTQPWPYPFPVVNQSLVPCPFLTVASWSTNSFLRRQVR